MKIKRIYTKLLLSFFGILVLTLVMILVMFIITAGRDFKTEMNRQAFDKLSVFKGFVKKTVAENPATTLAENRDLKRLIDHITGLFDLNIWITDPLGTVLVKTKGKPAVPPTLPRFRPRTRERDGSRLVHLSRRRISYYATVPLRQGGRELTCHILYDAKKFRHPEGRFFVGLLLIGGIIALLLVPMARFFSRRVNNLNRAALAFANGKLDRRADVKGGDEIADLAVSFNFMADKLEKLIRGAKELTANVSHELRSPLARIRLSKELIQTRLEKTNPGGNMADTANLFRGMEADIKALDTLIDHMLTLSKMDFQGWEPDRESFDLCGFLELELAKYSRMFTEKKIRVIRDIACPLAVFQDKSVLTTIFSNLLDNAFKYTPENGTVFVRGNKTCATLHLEISNTGSPLSSTELERIFEPFYRVKSNGASGHGLGLAITRKQVERCKGRIMAGNTPDGVAFKINLPEPQSPLNAQHG